MQKKPLKVEPALKIYQPKYPSFADKNPLLYPETRPYPFSLKFIKWASTGGLASIMLLSGGNVLGQAQKDSLYNPFPLENARVPYQPVSFGTGMPERLKSEEVRKAVMNAFVESGIELDEDVYLKNGDSELILSGYSNEDEIGFLLIDYNNMDSSFRRKSSFTKNRSQYSFKKLLAQYQDRRHELFLNFLKNKDQVVSRLNRYGKKEHRINYAENLSTLEPKIDSEKQFYAYHLQYELDGFWENSKDVKGLQKAVIQEINQRFETSLKKQILLDASRRFRLPENSTEEYSLRIEDEVRKLKYIKSDKRYIENYFKIIEFMGYNSDTYQLRNNIEYQTLKVQIMNSFPRKKWMQNLERLDGYQNSKFVSLQEARKIDKLNKSGKQLIAPISLRDDLTIVPDSYLYTSDKLKEELEMLSKEYNEKNGMTDEILTKRKQELKALSQKFNYRNYKDLSREKRDSIRSLERVERDIINAKYKAMEKLTDEERAVFNTRFAELKERENEWQKENAEVIRMNVLRKLEDEVKMYIKWANSQIGN